MARILVLLVLSLIVAICRASAPAFFIATVNDSISGTTMIRFNADSPNNITLSVTLSAPMPGLVASTIAANDKLARFAIGWDGTDYSYIQVVDFAGFNTISISPRLPQGVTRMVWDEVRGLVGIIGNGTSNVYAAVLDARTGKPLKAPVKLPGISVYISSAYDYDAGHMYIQGYLDNSVQWFIYDVNTGTLLNPFVPQDPTHRMVCTEYSPMTKSFIGRDSESIVALSLDTGLHTSLFDTKGKFKLEAGSELISIGSTETYFSTFHPSTMFELTYDVNLKSSPAFKSGPAVSHMAYIYATQSKERLLP